jgi:hypothetical protein
LRNGWYGSVDAELLYAMVRRFRPRQLLEIGSGMSTEVSATAALANRHDGHDTELFAIDPEPRVELTRTTRELVQHQRHSALDVPLRRFESLGRNDILFIDTTHTVKLGSEVNHLVLEVLPRLRPGVLVHFHDIFLPYEYPPAFQGGSTYMAEQYLLHAFLCMNPSYEVLLATHALARLRPERLQALVPSFDPGRDQHAVPPRLREHGPSSFWLRRRDSPQNGMSANRHSV